MVRRLRQHHAIEHATIAVLFERAGRRRSVVGLSDPGGFRIVGPFSTSEVAAAAEEAVRRLGAGGGHLAVTDLCGSNIVVAGALAGAGALLGAGGRPMVNLPRALVFAVAGVAAAPAVGRWVQRHLTTEADVTGLRVKHVTETGGGGGERHHVRVSIAAE